jgi:dimeric dUTPase (all-alpha-NTP-PPase superfamily)
MIVTIGQHYLCLGAIDLGFNDNDSEYTYIQNNTLIVLINNDTLVSNT